MKKNIILTLAVVAIVSMGTVATANAAPITVVEHSFEFGGIGNLPAPWVNGGAGGKDVTTVAKFSGGIPDGIYFAYMNGAGYQSQTLSATLQADTTYTLTIATGWRGDLPGLGFPTYVGYGIELWAGGNLLASDYDTVSGAPAIDTWKDATATFTSGSSVTADPLEIRLIGYGIQNAYDNVRLDGSLVPEPATMSLLALGGLGILARRRRRA
jgi:hypothetical protein